MNFDGPHVVSALLIYAIAIISLTFHEWGHAASADHLGDDTPRRQGRVTLNPLAHIDPIGTVLLPLLGAFGAFGGFSIVGWAKPVMIDPRNLPRTADRAWVTLAGPAMNLILALLAALAIAFLGGRFPAMIPVAELVEHINVSLMVFNLLPVPPLDGSKFLMYWFGMSEVTYVQFSRFGWVLLMLFLNMPQSRHVLGILIQQAMLPFDAVATLFT